jgi:hypothetical protein
MSSAFLTAWACAAGTAPKLANASAATARIVHVEGENRMAATPVLLFPLFLVATLNRQGAKVNCRWTPDQQGLNGYPIPSLAPLCLLKQP